MNRYRLGGLEDEQLLAALTGLLKRENDSLSDLLAHLAELDQRELCVALGYSSLFANCTEALGLCKSSAGRRIAAARVCQAYPQAFARVATGELQLSVLCALRPYLNAENAGGLFEACSRKSYEQVEELLAARFPKPNVRDLIRRLPARTVLTPHIESRQLETQPLPDRPCMPRESARPPKRSQTAVDGPLQCELHGRQRLSRAAGGGAGAAQSLRAEAIRG